MTAELDLSEAYWRGQIDAVKNNTVLTKRQKRQLLKKMRTPLEREASRLEFQTSSLAKEGKILDEAIKWCEIKPQTLERAGSSQLHKLLEANQKDEIYISKEYRVMVRMWAEMNLPAAQTFVIQHDWSAAFNKADEFDEGEFQLPANPVVFEMKISGAHVITLIGEDEAGSLDVGWFAHISNGWFATQPQDFNPNKYKEDIAWRQIRAVCIALEAEVATSEVIRAPHRLNQAREKRGNLPIRDYHIVSLMRRSRVPSLDESERERRSPRLHFRRGHWRHYDNHKTWIKWTLVGNPDLGFIDKEYRL